MSIQVVEQFSDAPGTCMNCGSSGFPDEVEEPKIQFGGIDINWGDSAYLCGECVKLICDLAERKTKAEYEELEKAQQELKDEHEELIQERNDLQEKVDKILEGSRAKKQLKEAVSG